MVVSKTKFRTIQDTGAWANADSGRPFEKLDIKRQASVLIRALGDQRMHTGGVIGNRTTYFRTKSVFQVIDQLREAGAPIKSLLNLRQAHVTLLINRWVADENAPATISARLSFLRWLTESLGKPGFVRPLADYGFDDSIKARTHVAKQDRSWTAVGIEPIALLTRVQDLDYLAGVQAKCMHAFGLRLSEAVMFRPYDSHQGNTLRIERGTKGGRTRLIVLDQPEQLEVLELAKAAADTTKDRSLKPSDKTVHQARRRLLYVFERLGITKEGLGVTGHGLRHQRANDTYERLTGVPTAVRGGGQVDPQDDFDARTRVTNDLGHARHSVTKAYTGPASRRRARVKVVRPKGQLSLFDQRFSSADSADGSGLSGERDT